MTSIKPKTIKEVRFDGRPFEYRRPNDKYRWDNDVETGGWESSPHSYEWLNPLYKYSEGQVTDAVRALGISNVNRESEVTQILDQIRNPNPVAAPTPAPAAETNNNQSSYTPTPIDVGEVYTPIPTPTPTPPTQTQTQTNQNTQEPFDTTPYDNIISQLSSQISSITQAMQTNTTNFNNQMAEYGKRFDEQQATYDKNLTSMRNTLLASNQPQREPVLGIKGAADKGNAQIKQLGRQGMKGTFSREGLRIKNINV